jgi:hypothetical protein
LPDGLVLDRTREVTVDHHEASLGDSIIAAQLIDPHSSQPVGRLQRVSLQVDDAGDPMPTLVVRSSGENSLWWVQDRLTVGSDGHLVGIARIGNQQTPAGSTFLLRLVQPLTDAAAAKLHSGEVLTDLADYRLSPTFVVTTGRSDDR